MKTLNVPYPEAVLSVLNLSSDVFEEEARTAMAMKLFEMGRLTSGQAAELAGITRVAFLLACPHYGCASVAWDREELEAEFGKQA